jgi:hypothetical protein
MGRIPESGRHDLPGHDASAMTELAGELHRRAAEVANQLAHLRARGRSTRRLWRAWRSYDDLASEAEGLAVAFAARGAEGATMSRARSLLSRVEAAGRQERDGWLDSVWVDIGVGD